MITEPTAASQIRPHRIGKKNLPCSCLIKPSHRTIRFVCRLQTYTIHVASNELSFLPTGMSLSLLRLHAVFIVRTVRPTHTLISTPIEERAGSSHTDTQRNIGKTGFDFERSHKTKQIQRGHDGLGKFAFDIFRVKCSP